MTFGIRWHNIFSENVQLKCKVILTGNYNIHASYVRWSKAELYNKNEVCSLILVSA